MRERENDMFKVGLTLCIVGLAMNVVGCASAIAKSDTAWAAVHGFCVGTCLIGSLIGVVAVKVDDE